MVILAPPSPGEPHQSLEGECLGRAAAGDPGATVGGSCTAHTHPLFPQSLSSRSSASSITARGATAGGTVGARRAGPPLGGEADSPEPPGGPPLPRPDSSAGRHLGASAFSSQIPGPSGQERGQGPAACQAGGHPRPSRGGAAKRRASWPPGWAACPGLGSPCPGPPRVSTSRCGSPVGWGPLMGSAAFPAPSGARWGGAPAHAESRADKRPVPREARPTLGKRWCRFSHGRCPRPGPAVTPAPTATPGWKSRF